MCYLSVQACDFLLQFTWKLLLKPSFGTVRIWVLSDAGANLNKVILPRSRAMSLITCVRDLSGALHISDSKTSWVLHLGTWPTATLDGFFLSISRWLEHGFPRSLHADTFMEYKVFSPKTLHTPGKWEFYCKSYIYRPLKFRCK